MNEVVLANAYQHITSNLYVDQTEEEVLQECISVKRYLLAEAALFGLTGVARGIHTALVIEELDDYSTAALLAYARLMHYDVEPRAAEWPQRQTAHVIHQLLLQRLERLREMSFVATVFFGDARTRPLVFPGIFYYTNEPDVMEIQERGPDYYFPRLGNITLDVLKERFDFLDMLHLLKNNYDRSNWQLTGMTREEDIARALLMEIENSAQDPRMFLTLDGPVDPIVHEPTYTSMSISDMIPFEIADLQQAAASEGISWRNPDSIEPKSPQMLQLEYVVSQLTNAFTSHVGRHRLVEEATQNAFLTTGQEVASMNPDELIFYGRRDGFSPMIAYSIQELYEHFNSSELLYTPRSIREWPNNPLMWVPFSRSSIRRLLEHVLPAKRRNVPQVAQLEMVLQRLLADEATEDWQRERLAEDIRVLKAADPHTTGLIKRALMRMRNFGYALVNFNDQIAYLDPDSVENNMLRDPYDGQPLEPTSTGRVRWECRSMLLNIQESIQNIGEESVFFERLRMVMLSNEIDDSGWASPKMWVKHTDDAYTIRVFLEVMHDMSAYMLQSCLESCGMMLVVTAEMYHRELYDFTMAAVQVSVEESPNPNRVD